MSAKLSPSPRRNPILLMALAAAYAPISEANQAGRADFTSGDVRVRSGNEAPRPLARGGTVASGDLLECGTNGRAQIRFSDGQMISLQPGSEFRIDQYAFNGKPDGEEKFFVSLLKGGLRAVSGAIGKARPDAYRVTTTTATIGIRGTEFVIAYNPDGSLSISAGEGLVEVCSQAGCITLAAGETGLVSSPNQPPRRTFAGVAMVAPPVDNGFAVTVTDNTQSDGTAASVPARARVVSSIAGTGAGLVSNQNKGFLHKDGAITLDSNGQPQFYLAQGNAASYTRAASGTFSSSGSIAAGDFLVWGSWPSSTGSLAFQPLAYVFGQPTPTASLPSTGLRASFSLAGATDVYSSTGAIGKVTSDSTLSVDFTSGTNAANLNLGAEFTGTNAATYRLAGTVNGTGSFFEGKVGAYSSQCTAGTATCDPASISGFIGGPNANSAGVSFQASSSAHGQYGGAAVFSRTGSPASIPTTEISGSATLRGALTYMKSGGSAQTSVTGADIQSGPFGELLGFSGSQATRLKQGFPGQYDLNTGRGVEFGAIGANPQATEFIAWGRWEQGTKTYGPTTTLLDQVHYLVANLTPTGQMPTGGTGTYSLVGGTRPTSVTTGGATQVGDLTSASLSVNFATSSTTFSVSTSFGGATASTTISQTGGVSNSYLIGTGGPAGCGRVMFSGNQASRAGVLYRFDSGNTSIGTVAGAVGLQRTQ